jgi:hypothetical protein
MNNFHFRIGLASRKFVQDNYIFRNGIIEDVPIEKYLELLRDTNLKII